MIRPIAPSLSPNTEYDDVVTATAMLLQPWKWKRGNAFEMIHKRFQEMFHTQNIYLLNSARSALYLLLQSFGVGKGDEVILQAFTCVAVPDPVLWVGATPIYADIDDSGNMDPSLLEKIITKKTKVIIVQHTFGIPAEIKRIQAIARDHGVILVEDCAHAFGATYEGTPVGTFGDASIISFGRDKVLSSVFGGVAILNSTNTKIKTRMEQLYAETMMPGMFWIFQQLLHPILFALILPTYDIGIGKFILEISKRLGLLSLPIYSTEKTGGRPEIFPKLYPNALAYLLANQVLKLDRYNNRRVEIARRYHKELVQKTLLKVPEIQQGNIYLRYNIQIPQAKTFFLQAKKRNILLGNWYHNCIDPDGVGLSEICYKKSSCPKAEYAAQTSVNLPTHPTMSDTDVSKVISLFDDV